VDAVAGIFGSDQPDAISVLEADHRKVEELFAEVKANEDGNNAAIFRQIKQELDIHSHIEEQVFYPHLLSEGDKELQKIVREGVEEHAQVKDLLTELDGLSGTSPTFKAKLKVLMENVEHHVEEEEGEMFDMAREQIPEETMQRLGALLEAEKARVKKRGAPQPSKGRAAAARQR
jgi:hemerythrin superfamily protein